VVRFALGYSVTIKERTLQLQRRHSTHSAMLALLLSVMTSSALASLRRAGLAAWS
jgi:hypothetical protein